MCGAAAAFWTGVGLASIVGMAMAIWASSLIGVWALAVIINMLAPQFGGQLDPVRAYKVAAYSATAGWLVGVVRLIPALGILGLAGLYSLYLLYTGLPVLMKTPADRAQGYTAVVILAAIVVFVMMGVFVRLAA